MPPKRMLRGETRKNKNKIVPRKGKKQQHRNGRGVLVYKPSQKLGSTPLPPRMITRFSCEADYKVVAATSTITNGYVYANTLYTPFYNVVGAVGTLPYTFLGPATAATLQPTGATSLLNSTLYSWYKVTRSRIKLQLIPGPGSQNFEVTVCPSIDTATPSTIYLAKTQPFSKSAMFSSTGSGNKSLNLSVTPGQMLGMSRLEQRADDTELMLLFGSTPQTPLLAYVWSIFLQTVDGSASSAAALLRVRLEFDAELLVRFSRIPTTLATHERKYPLVNTTDHEQETKSLAPAKPTSNPSVSDWDLVASGDRELRDYVDGHADLQCLARMHIGNPQTMSHPVYYRETLVDGVKTLQEISKDELGG